MDDYGETEGSQPQLWPGPAGDSVRAGSQHSVKAGSGVPELQNCIPRETRDAAGGGGVGRKVERQTDGDGSSGASPLQDLPGAVSSGF